MLKNIKNRLKVIWPVTIKRFVSEMSRNNQTIKELKTENELLFSKLTKKVEAENEHLLSQILTILEENNKKNLVELNAINAKLKQNWQNTNELIWADIFNSSVIGCSWANQSYSPGRWAVGYQFLYVMYRILKEIKPQRILDLGLGQSTKILDRYAQAHTNIQLVTVEHDGEWINFFKRNFQLSTNSKITKLDREFVSYKEAKKVRVFKDFDLEFQEKKFDFISIDAPFGGDMKEYSRIDVLRMMPHILSDDFVILIDDSERKGEQHTIREMELCLAMNNIPFKKGVYSGQKSCTVICAEHLGFLTTM